MPKSYTTAREKPMSTTEPDDTLESLGALLGAIHIRGDSRNYKHIPPAILEGLTRYAEEGVPTGEFLQAVIANDFLMAVGRADIMSMRGLPAIACYVYQELPSRCHGSRAVYRAWIHHFNAKTKGDKELERKAKASLISAKNKANDWTTS